MWTNEELINMCKREVEKAIKFQLNSKRFNYLIRPFSEEIDLDTHVQFKSNNFQWEESKKIENQLDDYFSTNWYIPLSAEGQLIFSNKNDDSKKILEHSFSLFIDMWFHFDNEEPSFSFDILDDAKKLLKDYNERIWSVIETENLKSLLDEEERFDNKSSAQFFTDITRLEKNKPVPFNDFDMHDDLVMCHQDIVFAIGELHAYKLYISDFTKNPVSVNGNEYFQYFPSFYDKRYLATCGKILELLYNYWDKIGDILAPYFTPQIPETKIFFGKVIDKIDNNYANSKYYVWLKEFKVDTYEELNKKRIQIVHYTTMESQIMRNFNENISDYENLKKKQEEKENFTLYFNKQYLKTIEGFYNALKLIEMK